jgi:DNA-binding transcriptional LysR family regulator
VIAPALARRLELTSPADLARAPLIHVTSFPLAWPAWLEGAGAGDAPLGRSIWVDTFGAALQAAEAGVGAALTLEPLASVRAAGGAVLRPFAFQLPTGAYWLLHRREDQGRPTVRAFHPMAARDLGRGAGLERRSPSPIRSTFGTPYPPLPPVR